MTKKRLLITFMLVAVCIAAAVAQTRDFVNVSGTSLENRLDEALRQGRAGGGRFWAAYSYPLRPGVVISDARGVEGPVIERYAEVSPQDAGGARPAAGARAALFLLYQADGGEPTLVRAEISDASRQRASVAGGERVYWLGEAGGAESFSLLRRLIDSSDAEANAARRREDVAARLTDAVALHEDAPAGSVTPLLEQLARGARATGARLRAVSWLGRTPGESSFVLGLAREEGQPREVRRLAIRTLLKSAEASGGAAGAGVVSLRQLYDAVGDKDLKAEVIDASPKRRNKEEVTQFLRDVARDDPDTELRERADWRLNSKKVLGEKGAGRRRRP
ncbi:MAG TPA: hypothetical protein VF668_17905 [Pyrinomonadaceae bacterium]|jgi:hypothetical protein